MQAIYSESLLRYCPECFIIIYYVHHTRTHSMNMCGYYETCRYYESNTESDTRHQSLIVPTPGVSHNTHTHSTTHCYTQS